MRQGLKLVGQVVLALVVMLAMLAGFSAFSRFQVELATQRGVEQANAEVAAIMAPAPVSEAYAKNAITLADYERIPLGATAADLDAVLQGRCPITGENVIAGHHTMMVTCQNRDGSNALFMIQNGRVVQRNQLGL